jgi:hypothetical protein
VLSEHASFSVQPYAESRDRALKTVRGFVACDTMKEKKKRMPACVDSN